MSLPLTQETRMPVFVSLGGEDAIPYYSRVASGALVAHEVSFGEDNFGTIFVEPRPRPQPKSQPASGVFGTLRRFVQRDESGPEAKPTDATEHEMAFFAALIRAELGAHAEFGPDVEPVFYLQQMDARTAARFAEAS